MAAPETPTALGPCPSDEELAAFLDGMLPAGERARITAHLADCASCFEIFAGAVHFQHEAAGTEGAKGTVLPFPAKKEEPRPHPWHWGAYAAAAVLAVGVGLAGYRWLFVEPPIVVADLVKPLAGRPGVAEHLYHSAYRGGEDGGNVFLGPPAFMVGARLVDLQLSLALGQTGNAANLLKEMSRYLKQIPLGSDEDSKQCLQDAAALEHDASLQIRRRIAETWRLKEGELDEYLALDFAFGKWAEAGRLAAATRTPDFFSSRANQRFLRRLLKDRTELEKDAVPSLEAIRTVWDRGDLRDEDYQALAANFEQISDLYRARASASDL